MGEREIDGHRALGFRSDTPAGTQTLWGDPKTGLPLRLESTFSGVPHTEVVMRDFQLDVELKPSLFDTTPPAGYQVQSFDVDASPYKEADLVQALAQASELSADHEFPVSLDTAGSQKLIFEYAKQLGVGSKPEKQDAVQPNNEQMKLLMQEGIKIGRGIGFALQLPDSADAQYAGRGVKRDAPDVPIFWYKPEGQEKYRVIYADLKVRESDAAPQVAGAVRIDKASQAAPPAKP